VTEIELDTSRREEMIDITERVRDAVEKAGLAEGLCLVYTPHTTCAVAVNEGYDPAVVADLIRHLRELVPREAAWQHAEGNSDAHIKSILVGGDVTLPVSAGALQLGRWQAVFLCEFDGPRRRRVQVLVR
jgi:secondary thiamine-phosphate synthase enzyme